MAKTTHEEDAKHSVFVQVIDENISCVKSIRRKSLTKARSDQLWVATHDAQTHCRGLGGGGGVGGLCAAASRCIKKNQRSKIIKAA